MNNFLRAAQLILALAGVIFILIVGPAIWLGVAGSWKVIFLSLSYFGFFIGTVWRVLRYGQLVSRDEDEQVKETSGRLAALVTVIGLLGVHWLVLYDFARDRVTNFNLDQLLPLLAIVLIISAIITSQIAILTLGKFFDRLAIKSDHQLVRDGIYSIVRHPIYTSYILLFLGYCTMLQSLLGFGLLTAVCVVWFGNRIGIEERMLEGKFGEEYKDYCNQTKRLFPYIY